MPALYLTELRSTLRQDGDALAVTRERDNGRDVLVRLPPHHIEMVGLVGDVHITADATRLCLDQGIAICWLTWGGRLRGRVVPEVPRSADLRLRQYAAATDPEQALARARTFVSAKLTNAAAVLTDLRGNYPGTPGLAVGPDLMELAGRVAAATDRETLLGLEGAGARLYFGALGTVFRADITFTGRQRRPPPDPANAILSFAYVLLGNHLAGLLEARGLDPALGFLHEVRPGRASLALDLLEELRHPIVDRFVLRVCNLRVLRPNHFEPDPDWPGGMRLGEEGRKLFFTEWEKALRRPVREPSSDGLAVRPLLQRQVERLAMDLRGAQPYRPLHFGR